MMNVDTKTEAAAVAHEVRAGFKPRLIPLANPNDPSNRAVALAVPNASGGIDVRGVKELLDEYLVRPERRDGTAQLQTIGSFVELVNRHKRPDSVVFADRKAPSLTAVIDYQGSGPEGAPDWASHRAVYQFPKSPEWIAWAGQEGKWLSMAEFAEFLDKHVVDVRPPPTPASEPPTGLLAKFLSLFRCSLAGPSDLIALAQGLTVHVASEVGNHQRRETGEIEITFAQSTTRTTDRRGLEVSVPGAFVLAIPVFDRGKVYEIPVRLRYRSQGKVEWSFDLFRRQSVWDAAVEADCERVHDETELPLFYGSPEV